MTDENLEQGTKLEEPVTKPAEPKVKASEGEGEVSESKGEVSEEASKGDATQQINDALKNFMKTPEFAGLVQSAKDKSILEETAPLKGRIAELEKSVAEKETTFKEAQEAEKWGDIPEDQVKDFHAARRELGELARITQTSMDKHQEELKGYHAWELSQETGVDMKDLLSCKTPEEMDVKAKQLADKAKNDELETLRKKVQTSEESTAKSQKIDSSTPGGAGVDLDSMSADEKIQAGLKQK